jgi:transposase-like protein
LNSAQDFVVDEILIPKLKNHLTLAVFPRESADKTVSAQGRPAYRTRKPEASPLWQLVTNHAHTFLEVYDDRYAPRYGPLRAVVPRALEGFHRCGLLAWGFARVRCPACRHEYLLAFSCKQRCLCPACHPKRQAAFGEFVSGEILEPVPHRHVVISLPRRLRPFFRRRRRLTRLACLVYETVKELLQAADYRRGGNAGTRRGQGQRKSSKSRTKTQFGESCCRHDLLPACGH